MKMGKVAADLAMCAGNGSNDGHDSNTIQNLANAMPRIPCKCQGQLEDCLSLALTPASFDTKTRSLLFAQEHTIYSISQSRGSMCFLRNPCTILSACTMLLAPGSGTMLKSGTATKNVCPHQSMWMLNGWVPWQVPICQNGGPRLV